VSSAYEATQHIEGLDAVFNRIAPSAREQMDARQRGVCKKIKYSIIIFLVQFNS
jgi:hypothetical protein